MPDQPSLFESDSAPVLFHPEAVRGRSGRAAGYNMFTAIVPTAECAEQAIELGSELHQRHGLRWQRLPLENLHVSLHAVADFSGQMPMQVVDAARAAAARVACPPLSIAFTSARTFPNPVDPNRNAFVLRCDAHSDEAVARLRRVLGAALRQSGLHPKAFSTPHMTLQYDPQVITEHPIEPIVWQAASFCLILSHVGLGHHERLGKWPLG